MESEKIGGVVIQKGVNILDTDDTLKLIWAKLKERAKLKEINQDAKRGHFEEVAMDLGIKRSAYWDLKKYIKDGEIRESRVLPLGVPAIKKMLSALGIEHQEIMHCIKV